MNTEIKNKNILLSGILALGFLFLFGASNASAANDCGTAAFRPDWKCTDINASNNIFNPATACVTGHCDGQSNIRCCRQSCDAGESCQAPAAGLTCASRGVCEGSRQCCKAGNGSTPAPLGGGTTFVNPLKFSTVEGFLGGIMSAIQRIIVVLALVFILIGAVMILTSAGNSGMVEKGKSAITMALVGLALGVAAPSLLKELAKIIGWIPKCNPGDVICENMGNVLSLTQIAMNVLKFLLGSMGILALVMMVIGASMYLTSAGDEDRIDKGKDIFKYALLGVVLAMGSMVLVTQIAKFFQ